MKKLLLILLILLTGCTKENKYSYDMFYMDTYINVKVYDISKSDSIKIFKKIDNIFKEYNELSDRYNELDIVNIYYLNNKLNINEYVKIDNRLYEMLVFSKDMYEKTDGLVNIGLGNVIDIFRYNNEFNIGLPKEEELINSGSINLDDIVLEDYKFMKKSNIKLDLGSIAKGYATEIVGNYLKESGYKKYIINAGGNVKTGEHYNNSKYKIGIEDPLDSTKLKKIVKGNNISVVTSGSNNRYYEFNNKRYSHIINPKTLYPSDDISSVTIITNDSGLADAMSTYLYLLPLEEAIKYANESDIVAMWQDNHGNLYYSNGFNLYE